MQEWRAAMHDRAAPRPAARFLNHFLRRMRREDLPRSALPADARRSKLSPVKALLVLLRNLLISRKPIYGVGEWAACHVPNLLGLAAEKETGLPNDECAGRAWDRRFPADVPSLVLAVAAQVIKEFAVSLDELHNDSPAPGRSSSAAPLPAGARVNTQDYPRVGYPAFARGTSILGPLWANSNPFVCFAVARRIDFPRTGRPNK